MQKDSKDFERLDLNSMQKAKDILSQWIRPTPLVFNPKLSDSLGCEVYLKLETMTAIGSFKHRGATYKISKLTPEQKEKGVIAASAGNHAQGVAWGSKIFQTKATIVMPKYAPLTKIHATKKLGAEVILHGENLNEVFQKAQEIQSQTGKTFVHPYEDPDVIAGQGSIGLEIHEQLPDADVVIAAIGGGGLLAGSSISLKALNPKIKMIGGQALGANSITKSIQAGHAVELEKVETFADGIAVKKASQVMFELLQKNVDAFFDVSEEQIAVSTLNLLDQAKVLVEGACAVPLAVCEKIKKDLRGKKVVLILGGGNIDLNLLNRIIDRGLVGRGRRLRLTVTVSDKPGSLARVTDQIAKSGGNILQAIHDRNLPSHHIDKTDIEFTLETNGKDHSDQIVEALRPLVLSLDRHEILLDE